MNSNYKLEPGKIGVKLSKENINITNLNYSKKQKSCIKEQFYSNIGCNHIDTDSNTLNEYSDTQNEVQEEAKSEMLRSRSTGPSIKKVALIPTSQVFFCGLKFDPPKIGVKYATTESVNGIKIEKSRVKQITLAHIVKDGVDPDRVVDDLFRCYPKYFNKSHTKEDQVKELVMKLIEYHQKPKEEKNDSKQAKKISRNSISSVPKLALDNQLVKKIKTSRQLNNQSEVITIN